MDSTQNRDYVGQNIDAQSSFSHSEMTEQDPISRIFKATAAGAGAGVFAAMMKSTWSEQQVRTMTTLSMMPALASSTKVFADCALLFAGCGFVFSSVEEISKGIRQTDDAWNSVLGSLAAGNVLGIRFKCFKTGLGSGRIILGTDKSDWKLTF